jgi:hypothetical protein
VPIIIHFLRAAHTLNSNGEKPGSPKGIFLESIDSRHGESVDQVSIGMSGSFHGVPAPNPGARPTVRSSSARASKYPRLACKSSAFAL